ncbi:SMP-30/gluconolactonase/LRE family protein [Microbacterium sp. KSW4-16]|uniref:SMP-30/gluconolactonase/LRE family protein n=1 Tax=Microbacterium TaxID=33882 RepID=UPI00103D4417|nr:MULTISPECIES: SMP-30/gluconolactonase/LRE family protein [Microbacterium]MCK8467525.1 SMP-30/gluconolactonase/LRE family protein [Microbacterium aurugineum]QEA28109.1 SMP-30/gluconolactonase/LRE family protein [Microbacterium sp. CBA3102]TCJ22910.1 SMP-30/gluconolactonase/LRE family protein [Microbacterium sp. PI-1]
MTPDNVTGPVAHHAEGPVWWSGWGGLRWVDGTAGDLLTLRRDGVTRQHLDDEYLAFARPRVGGGLVAVGARTLYLADDVDGQARAVATLLDDPRVRMNDGCCDPRGRLIAGSMAYDATPDAGVVLRLDADLAISTVLAHTTVSNGVGFSPDGRRVYYVDTMTHRIDVFDVVEGELRGRRTFATIPEEQGLPDGLTVAADGSVWVALWGGSAVHGYDASGALVETIALPVPQVSACTFGGDDLGTLYITTSAQGLSADHGTDAGSVYAARPGVHGVSVTPFAG